MRPLLPTQMLAELVEALRGTVPEERPRGTNGRVTKGRRHQLADQRSIEPPYPDQIKRPKASKARSALPAPLLNAAQLVVDDVAKRPIDRRQVAAIELPGGKLRRELVQQRGPRATLVSSTGGRASRLDGVGSNGSCRPGHSLGDDLADGFGAARTFAFDPREHVHEQVWLTSNHLDDGVRVERLLDLLAPVHLPLTELLLGRRPIPDSPRGQERRN